MSASQLKSRYPGSIAFAKEDHALFFGREKELKKLFDLLQIKKMLILFSASGMGKSSLINAGLIPLMESRLTVDHAIPVPVRFWYYDRQLDKDPRALVNKIIIQLRNHRQHLPIIKIPMVSDTNEESLWYELKLFALNKIRVILIIDQSEEIFDYMPDQIEALKDELYSIFSGVPENVDEECSREVLRLEKILKDEDQLMQLDKDVEFIYADLNTKVLMVIRDDKLGYFNAFTDYFPDMLKDSYKLLPLTKEAAANAIALPAGVKGEFVSKPFSYTQEALIKLLKNLEEEDKKGTYDPFIIQIICRFIENTVIINQHKVVVNPSDIPDISKPVKRYIDDIWKNLPVVFGKYFVKERIEKKLIEHGRGRRISAHENNKWINPKVSDYLVKQGFLKRERRENLDYLELSHDRLVPPLSRDYQSRIITSKQIKWISFVAFIIVSGFYLLDKRNERLLESKNTDNTRLTTRNDSLKEAIVDIFKSDTAHFNSTDSNVTSGLIQQYKKQLYKIDIFYLGTDIKSMRTADSLVEALSSDPNYVIRKRRLGTLSSTSDFRTLVNQIRFNGDEEYQQALKIDSIIRQSYGINRIPVVPQPTLQRSPNYLSIVLKNAD